MIEIDGSYGEGGGQVLRTALSLSCLLGAPFRIINVRKSRKKPGLMAQHLTAVRAAQRICSAVVTGDTIGSVELSFAPGRVRGGSFSFDIGTAGSTSLVLQTIIPSMLFSGDRSRIVLTGGTHVPFSPSFHYLAGPFATVLERLGIRITLTAESCGFYPKGGGRVRADISPVREIGPLMVAEWGELRGLQIISGVGNLPLSIAERQADALIRRIGEGIGPVAHTQEILSVPTPGQGTFVHIDAVSSLSRAGFTALGERGKRAEAVGEEAADAFLAFRRTGAGLDRHLADQIVLYLALCRGFSRFTTEMITQHLLTNLHIISLFHSFRYEIEGGPGETGTVMIDGCV